MHSYKLKESCSFLLTKDLIELILSGKEQHYDIVREHKLKENLLGNINLRKTGLHDIELSFTGKEIFNLFYLQWWS